MEIMDIKMPNMDGVQATKELKKNKFMSPIVGLSANAMEDDEENYINEGMDDYLSKPVIKERLYKICKSIQDKSFKSKSGYDFGCN